MPACFVTMENKLFLTLKDVVPFNFMSQPQLHWDKTGGEKSAEIRLYILTSTHHFAGVVGLVWETLCSCKCFKWPYSNPETAQCQVTLCILLRRAWPPFHLDCYSTTAVFSHHQRSHCCLYQKSDSISLLKIKLI